MARHRARKRFGQHFLTDPGVIDAIVRAISPGDDDVIVEIGPGQGAITEPLARSAGHLHLVELDRDLVVRLRSQYADRANVTIHEADALQFDFGAIGDRLRIVGNLPYNISTPLLFHVLQWSDRIRDMHFMLQQEVVARMAASPGGKAWGKLSVMCQYHCSVTPLFNVPPEAFRPVPAVQSTFVRLLPHARPPVRITDRARFERLVTRAFSMRRKTLRNSLRGMLDATDISAAGIDPGLRPEQLGLADFAALAERLG